MPLRDKPLIVYVAGPYSGGGFTPEENVEQACRAANDIIDAGHVPIVPHLSHYLDALKWRDRSEWLAIDFKLIERCDCLVRLHGESPGAVLEVWRAKTLGIPVFDSLAEFLCIERSKTT